MVLRRLGVLVALFILSAVCPSRSLAFAGHDILNGNPWWHQEISSRALRATGFSAASDSAIKWHADYIDSYGYSPLWWAQGVPVSGANRFRYSMAQLEHLERMHFDDLTSTDDVRVMWNRYLTGAFVGLQWAAEHNDVAAAQNIIGISLHSIEDFYSHSSWLNAPDRRDAAHTWLASPPAERVGREIYTGAYEHPETAIKHHGKINIICTIMSQAELAPLADALCTAISPLSNSSFCSDYKGCKDGTQVQYVVNDVTLPNGLMFLSPPGIALDNVNIARVGAKERDLVGPDGRLKNGRTTKPAHEELFDDAVDMATAAATEWLRALEQAMQSSGQGEFWGRVKSMPSFLPDPVLWSQFEDFKQLPYFFMSAGAYPPDANQRAEKDEVYLRVRIKTADEQDAGTDGTIKLKADGRSYALDYAPYDALPMRINDFERGDNFQYTVGPFDHVPSQIELENVGLRMDDLAAAIERDIEETFQKLGVFFKDLALSLVSGEADHVADQNQKFDLAQVRRAGSQSVGLSLNGGSEGNYTLYATLQRTAGGPADATHRRAWSRYRLTINTLKCEQESKWDRGSNSDEPFVLLSMLPMPYGEPWGQRQAAIIGPYDDVDSGEQVNVGYGFSEVDLPDDVGVLALKAMQYESDDEPATDRQALLANLATWLRDDSANNRPSSMDILAQGVAGDWKIAELEVYAFSRYPQVRGGTVFNSAVNQWVASNSSANFTLDGSRVRSFDAQVAPFVTPKDAAVSGGGGGNGSNQGGGAVGGRVLPRRNEFGDENLALGRPAQQSSTAHMGDPARAVDGNADGAYANGSVTHTDKGWVSWWSVDLGDVYEISSVKVWNRTDCCAERTEGFSVLVAEEALPPNMDLMANNPYSTAPYLYGPGNYHFNGAPFVEVKSEHNNKARFVCVAIPRSEYLSLAEVQVFGHKPGQGPGGIELPPPVVDEGPNRAKGQPARQSSTALNAEASRAVDGDTSGVWTQNSVTHTKEEPIVWWEVDLGQSYDVSRIRLWNRTDCCSERLEGCIVLVGDDPQILDQMTATSDWGNSANPAKALIAIALQGSKRTPAIYGENGVQFGGAAYKDVTSQRNRRGRYVRIVQPRTHILSLAEVEVYGKPVGP